jgi:predicted Zn-dependent protease
MMQHKSLAEAYVAAGNLPLAVEQLQLALNAGNGDFYQMSSIEARLRELREYTKKQ